MTLPTQRSYRLVPRGGPGLACDEDGLALGAVDLARAQTDARGVRRCVMRSAEDVGKILRASFGPQDDETVRHLHQGLGRAAALIEAGELGRAGIQAVMLGVPDLTPDATRKLSAIADLEKAGTAWETEPRIPADSTGAGQWTTGGGGGGAPKIVLRPKKTLRTAEHDARADRQRPSLKPALRSSRSSSQPYPVTTASPMQPMLASLVVPAPAGAVNGFSLGEDIPLSPAVARLGAAGLLALGATLLNRWDAEATRKQIANAMARFKLDPLRPADVVAATAYVWSQYQLGFHTKAPFNGPELDAASEAVMRRALIRPGAFVSMLQNWDRKSVDLMMAAANGALADYAAESRARPPGVDASLQANSAAARKAIGLRVNDRSMQVHHLVTAEAWGKYQSVATLAKQAGWNQNAPSNVIALPSNSSHQAELAAETGIVLPVHQGSHAIYNAHTLDLVRLERSKFPPTLRPDDALSILEFVAGENRKAIVSGAYNPIIRVAS